MADHDFRSLNDKDFEALCADLLGEHLGVRFERFKAGKDRGVDGRYFSPSRGEVILQSKHWPKSTAKDLVRSLKREEAVKVTALKPERYILAVSLELSRQDKASIEGAFHPFLQQEDIYGLEDINDLLDRYPSVERRHHKLWIRSSGVLAHLMNRGVIDRSLFAIEQMKARADRYVVTQAHKQAVDQLDRLGIVIVTGEPGVGKTMLAEQVCLSLVAEGFAFIQIHNDIHEGESVFAPEEKQVFYFDDFLGRNYLEAVNRNEGAAVTQFMSRVAADKTKRLVITSRSGILSQGRLLMDLLGTSRIKKNDYELRVTDIATLDRGRILYQHIWQGRLAPALIEEIYRDRRYRNIVSHKSFNPRLIEFITDPSNLEQVEAHNYWSFISESLDNPAEVWAHAFDMQLDDFSRSIVFLVVVNGRSIAESALRDAYRRFVALPGRGHMSGRQDFGLALRILVGSMLNRSVSENDSSIDLFNPSVGDFVIDRLKDDGVQISDCLVALRSMSSLLAIRAMVRNRLISALHVKNALASAMGVELAAGALTDRGQYLCTLFSVTSSCCPELLSEKKESFVNALRLIERDGRAGLTVDRMTYLAWGMEVEAISPRFVVDLLVENISEIVSDSELEAASGLLAECEGHGGDCSDGWSALTGQLTALIYDDFDSFITLSEIIAEHGPGDYGAVKEAVSAKVSEKFADLGVPFNMQDIEAAIEGLDVRHEVDRYFEYERESDFESYVSSRQQHHDGFDELDDLFDRG